MSATPPTLTSTASAGSGAKTYTSTTTSVCTVGSSSGVVAFVAAGTCTISASIAADSPYALATSSNISFTMTYSVGATGPSGGIIFMTPNAGANPTNYYFESAPGTWYAPSVDLNIAWCDLTSTLIGAPTALGTAVGTGRANTTSIVSICSSGAAKSARAYSGGGNSDWFLASIDELTQMYANRVAIGGFNQMVQVGTGIATTTYWSSSEYNSTQAKNWSFLTNGNDNWGKNYGFGVRPIRMFAPIG